MTKLIDLLFEAIDCLPSQLYAEVRAHHSDGVTTYQPVMKSWTSFLPLRHQGVLVSALRGCDGASKDDNSKALNCMMRRACLNPADDRETLNERGFFGFSPARLKRDFPNFLHSLDQYPLHYVTHLMHACEVIGYKHPDLRFREFFSIAYMMIVHKLHLNVETCEQMDTRLCFDRVAAGTVEKDF